MSKKLTFHLASGSTPFISTATSLSLWTKARPCTSSSSLALLASDDSRRKKQQIIGG